MAEFEGQVALVTGAASGIGRSTALLYARRGAKVIASDVTELGGRETVQLIKESGGEARFVHADLANPADCANLIRQTLDAYDRLDIAFNNAGIGGDSALTADYGIEAWQRVFNISLCSVFNCMKYEIKAMLRNGRGVIVNMSSIPGQVGFAMVPAYVSSKDGGVELTQAPDREYAAACVRINAVGPALVRMPLVNGPEQDDPARNMRIGLHPNGWLATPEEVAELVIWLSSGKPSIVGTQVPLDAGHPAR